MKAKVVGVIIALVVVAGGAYAALSLTRVGQGGSWSCVFHEWRRAG